MKLLIKAILIASMLLVGCRTTKPDSTIVIGNHASADPIPTASVTQITEATNAAVGLTNSSTSSATKIKASSSEIRTQVAAGSEGSISPQQVASKVIPKTDEIDTLSDSISKDQQVLREQLGTAQAEVLKMRKEIDRLFAETASVKAAYEADLKNLDVKYQGELSARDNVIKERDVEISGLKKEIEKLNATVKEILSGAFKIVIYFGVACICAGLALLYFLADKSKGAGAVVIGVIAVALGGMLPSMVDAASKAGVWLVWIVFGLVATYAIYLVIRLARSHKTNEQLFKTNLILGRKDASLDNADTKKQIDLVQDSTTKDFVASSYRAFNIK